jgi:hypothetical protein
VDCDFYDVDTSTCRFNPPVAIRVPELPQDDPDLLPIITLFPAVQEGDWCGKFSPVGLPTPNRKES